jgi:hypothetical protein
VPIQVLPTGSSTPDRGYRRVQLRGVLQEMTEDEVGHAGVPGDFAHTLGGRVDLQHRARAAHGDGRVHDEQVGTAREVDEPRVQPGLVTAEHDRYAPRLDAVGERRTVRVRHGCRAHHEVGRLEHGNRRPSRDVDRGRLEARTPTRTSQRAAQDAEGALVLVEQLMEQLAQGGERGVSGGTDYDRGA